MFNAEYLINLMSTYKEFAILISLAVSILIALLGVLPSIFVTAANVIFFGPFYGFLISLMGEVVGGTITFYLYRFGFKRKADSLGEKYSLLKNLSNSKGFKAGVLITQGRLIPFIPSGFVTLAAAISEVDVITFTIATFLGKIPSIALEALVSYDFINIHQNFIRLAITVVALIIVFITLHFKKSK